MPQFPARTAQPAQPESYRAAARRLRRFADKLEAHCAPQTPQERRGLTRTVNTLAHFARALFRRHNRHEADPNG